MKARYIIAGATGMLGQNLLFEILRRHRFSQLEVFVLGRANGHASLQQRLREIFSSDTFAPLRLTWSDREHLLKQTIRCIEADFGLHACGLSLGDHKRLATREIDCFFHVAGLTDLRSTAAAGEAVRRVNTAGTQRVLELASTLRLREFAYIGTAYVCAGRSGYIEASSTSHGLFRNPYEESKLTAELHVRGFAERTGQRCRYFRPSTICGCLDSERRGVSSKFEVFYSWPAFFQRLREKHGGDLSIRTAYNRTGSLNIVPVDYVARTMLEIVTANHPGESYHLTNHADTPHAFYMPRMLKAVGVTGIVQTDSVPRDQSPLEQLYYRSVGGVYTPYITADSMIFEPCDRVCPRIGEAELDALLSYAIERDFGRRHTDLARRATR